MIADQARQETCEHVLQSCSDAGKQFKRGNRGGVGKAGLQQTANEIRIVAAAWFRHDAVEQAVGGAVHGLSDMMISIEDRRRHRWYDVGAVNEAERGIAKPRRIVVEECFAAIAWTAKRIGDDRPPVWR